MNTKFESTAIRIITLITFFFSFSILFQQPLFASSYPDQHFIISGADSLLPVQQTLRRRRIRLTLPKFLDYIDFMMGYKGSAVNIKRDKNEKSRNLYHPNFQHLLIF